MDGTKDTGEASKEPHELCCIKCKLPSSRYEDLAIVRRGVEKIVDYSRFIKDDQMEAMLQHRIARNAVIRIHRDCQKKI